MLVGRQDIKGIHISRTLGAQDYAEVWDSIHVPKDLKESLLCQALLNFTLRAKVSRTVIPLHGIILLVGEPGTGKTSLARGLASKTAESLGNFGTFMYLEVEPHALASASLGKSQKAVTELLGSTIAEYAATQPLIVLLDEVETLAANRLKMSMDANPVDVHRATDAVLAQLDQLAAKYPQLLFLATSNFPAAIDEAFLSRADLVMTIEPPGAGACRAILLSTLEALATAFPSVNSIPSQSEFT